MLLKIENLIEGSVVKRPSKIIKTPYVADVIPLNSSSEILAHTASLGCCGLADVGASILMTKMPLSKNGKNNQKCSHRIYLAVIKSNNNETIVGIHPQLAEQLCESALQNNCLHNLLNCKSYKREKSILIPGKVDSRFDFSGIDENGIPFLDEKRLAKYSMKYYNILQLAKNSTGILFLFSRYIKPGILSMALMVPLLTTNYSN